ncbi:unnamed protein product [Heligmosomoides polygyrus]|uniref:Integrase n=1 Tax=Heligmosomoides polygyrus TaxID=6339 RepID=A0A183GHH9_HELPZ|nr:unnamed protein product [Heligmosomoides polygyrus]
MREKETAVISRVRLPTVTTADETWKKATDAIRQSELGFTKPGRRKVDKQTWLWTDDTKAKLESRDGERYLYRLAKYRNRQTEDIEKFFGINDENGYLFMDRKEELKRWRDYFEEISTVEFPHLAIPSMAHGPVRKITVEVVEAALKMMRPGKGTGPNDGAANLWNSKY